jgi:hypothetical protein
MHVHCVAVCYGRGVELICRKAGKVQGSEGGGAKVGSAGKQNKSKTPVQKKRHERLV